MKLLIGGTPTGTLRHIPAATYRRHCGMLTSWADGAHPKHAIRLGASWAMDNFAFTNFDADAFNRSLAKYEGLPGCLFVVAPDVWGNAAETAARFADWREAIKAHGYPVALAAQDGIEALSIDWNSFDALFVGGTDEFKYSPFLQELVFEARLRGKWTHMGRVNSRPRWNYCLDAGFDSVDGTGMVIERRRVLEALAIIDNPRRMLWNLRPAIEIA